MKTLISGTLLLSTLLLSFPAAADSWFSSHTGYSAWGHDRHRGWNGYRNPHRFHRDYYRSWHSPHRYRRDGGYFSFSYGSGHSRYRHRDHDFDAGALLGGVVLGSLLTSSIRDYDRPRNLRTYTTVRSTPVVRSREIVYVNRATPRRPAPSGRRLLRDLDGNCFEITRQADGDELRTQLHPSACDF